MPAVTNAFLDLLARGVKATERIATALETQLDENPLHVLHEALTFASSDDPAATPSHPLRPDLAPPRPVSAPFASNTITHLYRHPNPAWEIIASQDDGAESGWLVQERRKED